MREGERTQEFSKNSLSHARNRRHYALSAPRQPRTRAHSESLLYLPILINFWLRSNPPVRKKRTRLAIDLLDNANTRRTVCRVLVRRFFDGRGVRLSGKSCRTVVGKGGGASGGRDGPWLTKVDGGSERSGDRVSEVSSCRVTSQSNSTRPRLRRSPLSSNTCTRDGDAGGGRWRGCTREQAEPSRAEAVCRRHGIVLAQRRMERTRASV